MFIFLLLIEASTQISRHTNFGILQFKVNKMIFVIKNYKFLPLSKKLFFIIIKVNETWSTVCSSGFSIDTGDFICKEMGFTKIEKFMTKWQFQYENTVISSLFFSYYNKCIIHNLYNTKL